MVSTKLTITNPSGIHARPAGILAKAASRCESEVTIRVGEKKVMVKSILNLMAAAIKCGTEIELICDGPTEEKDLEELAKLIKSGLGE